MIITSHLHGPPGEATRRLVTLTLEKHRMDNLWVLQAMIRAGHQLPDNLWDLGVVYDPPHPKRPVVNDRGQVVGYVDEVHTPQQEFFSYGDVIERRRFSCGDGAPLEAALVTALTGTPTKCECVAQGGIEYHAIYYTPDGPVDPSERWKQRYQRTYGRPYIPEQQPIPVRLNP